MILTEGMFMSYTLSHYFINIHGSTHMKSEVELGAPSSFNIETIRTKLSVNFTAKMAAP
jgi:hypothetical protein